MVIIDFEKALWEALICVDASSFYYLQGVASKHSLTKHMWCGLLRHKEDKMCFELKSTAQIIFTMYTANLQWHILATFAAALHWQHVKCSQRSKNSLFVVMGPSCVSGRGRGLSAGNSSSSSTGR
jgi:hypothetical protein